MHGRPSRRDIAAGSLTSPRGRTHARFGRPRTPGRPCDVLRIIRSRSGNPSTPSPTNALFSGASRPCAAAPLPRPGPAHDRARPGRRRRWLRQWINGTAWPLSAGALARVCRRLFPVSKHSDAFLWSLYRDDMVLTVTAGLTPRRTARYDTILYNY